MLVRERMTPNPLTITPETPVPDALRMMRGRKVHRLPVVDSDRNLIGIVSEAELVHAGPSPATTLAAWEIPELLAKIKVANVMTRDVITVEEDTPLEEAARLLADHRIGAMPVMRGKSIVGIITETDIFKALLELLGGRQPGVRVTVAASGDRGTMAKITGAIVAAGGNIVGLGCREIRPANGAQWEMMFKVQDVPVDQLLEALRPVVVSVLDVRETGAPA